MANAFENLGQDDQQAVRGYLAKHFPGKTIEAVSKEAEAVHVLLALSKGLKPKISPFCSIQIPQPAPKAPPFHLTDDGEGLPQPQDPRTRPDYVRPT